MMKLLAIFLLSGLLQVSAAGYSQQVSVSGKKVSLEKVFKAIEKQTDYVFFYDQDALQKANLVTIDLRNAPLDQVLAASFNGQPLTYSKTGKTIVVTKRTAPVQSSQKISNNTGSRPLPPEDIEVTGLVTDSAGAILPGVTIVLKSKPNIGTTTDLNGRYVLKVPASGVLVFGMIGYTTQEIPISNRTSIDVVMRKDVQKLDEVVITAFGNRAKKRDVVGSVTTIDPKELKVPASNLTAALQGRIAGVISFQRSGEPGADNADFFVRGVSTFGVNQKPLILVDNMEVSTDDLARIPWDDLESFSVLRDATAAAVYGSRGANGVILVTTKLGKDGPPKLNLRAEQRVSMPTQTVKIADPITFMKMNREAILTRDPLDKDNQNVYSLEKIDRTIAGDDPILYPSVNWLDFLTKKVTTTKNYNLNISGGGQVATYNVSGNLTTDNGLLKIDPINNFNSNVKFNVYNLRTNVVMNITKTTRLTARANVNIQDYNGPPVDGSDAFAKALRSNPVLFQPVYTPPDNMSWIKHPMFGNFGEGGYMNAYAEIVKGYSERRRSNLYFQTELNQNLSFITSGLNFRGLANITRNSYFTQSRVYNPFYYTPIVNPQTGKADNFQVINPDGGTEYLNFVPGDRTQQSIFYGEAQLSFNRVYGKHGLSAMGISTLRTNVSTPTDFSLINTLPFRNISLSGNVAYNYSEKYYAQFSFGYNASERFDASHRWGFFPSFGVAWNVDREDFFEVLKPVFSRFKLRATYGLVGNDNISDTRFFYLSNINLNDQNRKYSFGLPTVPGLNVSGVSVSRYDNPYVQWEKSKQLNLGIDLSMFNGALTFTGDYYKQDRYNIVQTRAGIPASAGLQANVLANLGKYKSNGFEAELAYSKNISHDFYIQARGTFTYSSGKYVFYDEPTYAYSYLSRIGLSANQTRGYIAERLFIDDAEVLNSPQQQFGGQAVLGGDIKYVDINKDGVIDANDMVPIGYPTVPEISYGFGPSISYKSFDLSLYFTGNARTSLFINPTATYDKGSGIYGAAPFGDRLSPNAVLQAWADSYWSEDNQDVYANWPRLSQVPTNNNTQTSTFWMRDASFIRLKQAEIGYNLKGLKIKRYHVQNIRLYLSGTNLFKISRFTLWDPEMGGNGFKYPLQRVFNFGVNVNL
ncbi:TonB-dependent receptor [Niabella pedocola]|uniref:TonB-dependent receptor n=1 Tax=Niabella pedocola TaxID=1752077 RepID=A0ABS8PJ60_9BACT|nr:TonB-dependent receptor [Niabella pedocola]MCD2421128.1 TonB-dependent receptor [Niabella pedocola]